MPTYPSRPAGIVLAQRGEISFIRVDAVLAVDGDQVAFYCGVDEWPQSPDAQAARLDAAIAEAEAGLAQLLTERGQITALGDIRPPPALPAPEPASTPRRPYRRYRCLACGQAVTNFTLHARKAHPEVTDPNALRGPEVGSINEETPADHAVAPEAAAPADPKS